MTTTVSVSVRVMVVRVMMEGVCNGDGVCDDGDGACDGDDGVCGDDDGDTIVRQSVHMSSLQIKHKYKSTQKYTYRQEGNTYR